MTDSELAKHFRRAARALLDEANRLEAKHSGRTRDAASRRNADGSYRMHDSDALNFADFGQRIGDTPAPSAQGKAQSEKLREINHNHEKFWEVQSNG